MLFHRQHQRDSSVVWWSDCAILSFRGEKTPRERRKTPCEKTKYRHAKRQIPPREKTKYQREKTKTRNAKRRHLKLKFCRLSRGVFSSFRIASFRVALFRLVVFSHGVFRLFAANRRHAKRRKDEIMPGEKTK